MIEGREPERRTARPPASGEADMEVEAVDRFPAHRVLLAIFAGLAALRFAAALPIRQSMIFGDELLYWQMARSFWRDRTFLFHGFQINSPSVLYSVLLSPLFALPDQVLVFDLIRVVNALMVASVVFPSYALAREFLGRRDAVLCALFSGLAAAGCYSALVMPESLFFALFCTACWLLFRVLLRGSVHDALLAAAAVLAAFFTKPHVVVLLVGYFAAVAVWLTPRLLDRPARKTAARGLAVRLVPMLWLPVALLLRFVSGAGRAGGSIRDVLFGAGYATEATPAIRGLFSPEAFASVAELIAVLCLGGLFVPAGSFLARTLRFRHLGETDRLFVVLTGVSAAIYVAIVARLGVSIGESTRLQERYLFVLGPMLLVLALVSARDDKRFGVILGGTLAAVWVGLLLWGARTHLTFNVPTDSPSTALFFLLSRQAGAAWLVPAAAVVVALGSVAGWALARSRPLLSASIVAAILLLLNVGWYRIAYVITGDLRPRDFAREVDRVLGPGDRLALVADGLDVHVLWSLEYWVDRPLSLVTFDEKRRDWWIHRRLTPAELLQGRETYAVSATSLGDWALGRGRLEADGRNLSTPAKLLAFGPDPRAGSAARAADAPPSFRLQALSVPAQTRAGETFRVRFVAQNTGAIAWPSSGATAIRFGYHWSDPDRTGRWDSVVWDDGHRANLTSTVAPGQSLQISMDVAAPAAPGPTYRLVIAPYVEGPSGGWINRDHLLATVAVQ
jgi:4-amino-4-deoxy-L-arabinose transferase-like glycosyltransferase